MLFDNSQCTQQSGRNAHSLVWEFGGWRRDSGPIDEWQRKLTGSVQVPVTLIQKPLYIAVILRFRWVTPERAACKSCASSRHPHSSRTPGGKLSCHETTNFVSLSAYKPPEEIRKPPSRHLGRSST